MKYHIDARQGQATESWWLDGATFYAEARKRFPETGAAETDRNKVRSWGQMGPALQTRLREVRQQKRDRP